MKKANYIDSFDVIGYVGKSEFNNKVTPKLTIEKIFFNYNSFPELVSQINYYAQNIINIDEKKSMFVYINFREKNKIRYERFINYILYNDLKCDKIIWSNLYEFKPKETEEGLFNKYKNVLFNC